MPPPTHTFLILSCYKRSFTKLPYLWSRGPGDVGPALPAKRLFMRNTLPRRNSYDNPIRRLTDHAQKICTVKRMGNELSDIVVVKPVSAFRAEFRRMPWVLRLPAAFVTAVQRRGSGLSGAALRAELPFVYASAGADPALHRLWRAAFGAELPGVLRAAAAFPGVCGGSGRLLSILLLNRFGKSSTKLILKLISTAERSIFIVSTKR